jgi:CubicO group peptidase (beta-lactamase class C family)
LRSAAITVTAVSVLLTALSPPWLFFAGLGRGSQVPTGSWPRASSAPDETPDAKLQQLFQSFFSGDSAGSLPGFAVLVKKDRKIVFEKGYGVRDLRRRIAIDAQTNFRLASVTKQFTAMAIMLLVRDRRLRYDRPLTDIFPEFPAYGKQITIRNLLNHTGGLPDYEDLMESAEKRRRNAGKNEEPLWSEVKQIRDAEVLQLLEKESQAQFPAGTKWAYSNSGYVVLGLIVAKVSGKSFGDFLHERIFVPLKMGHTLAFEKGKNEIPNRAYGHKLIVPDHRPQVEVFSETDQSSTSATQGDGGIYSNLEDLSKWDDALANHTLLSENDFLPASTPAKLPPGAEAKLAEDVPESLRGHAGAYGFGWFLNLEEAHPLLWHYGDTMGFKSAILRYTRDNVTVIFLSNRTDLDQGALALQAAQLFLAAP